MKTAVILAAGRSARSGRVHKAGRRLRWRGQTHSWLDAQIDRLRCAGYRRIHLVLGINPRRVLKHLHRRVILHINPRGQGGSFASLCCALAHIRGSALIVPLDNPVPERALLYRLHQTRRTHVAAQPRHRARNGHPVLLNPNLIAHLLRLDPGQPKARLDRQIRACGEAVARIDSHDPRCIMNLNREQDWVRFQRLHLTR